MRRHDNMGYAPTYRHPVKWTCGPCGPNAKLAYKMRASEMDVYEQNALIIGSEAAGQYLDSVGQTDLAKLSQEQFYEMFFKFMQTYEHTMQTCFNELKETLQ